MPTSIAWAFASATSEVKSDMRWSERLATPFAAFLLLTVGCQPTVYLMPTPEAIGTGEVDPFALNAGDNLENRNYVAYATNRLPVGTRDDRQYLTLFDRKLRVGLARIRFGSEEDNWASLHAASTTSERDREIPLFLENATEMAVIPTDPPPSELSAEAQAFFDELDAAFRRASIRTLPFTFTAPTTISTVPVPRRVSSDISPARIQS